MEKIIPTAALPGPDSDPGPYLVRFGRRLRWRDGWLRAQRTLWLAGCGALLAQMAGRLWPLERPDLWTIAPAIAWLSGVLAFSIFQHQTRLKVAQRVDLELNLKEKLSTAVALDEGGKRNPPKRTLARSGASEAEHSPSRSQPRFQPALLSLQRADALAVAREIAPRQAFPLRWLPRPLLLAVILIALAVFSAWLPNPMDAVRAERAAVAREAQAQAQRVADLSQQLAEAQQLTPEERAEVQRQLAELARQLRENPGDRSQALADLSKMEESLRQRLDPNAGLRQAALQALANQLQSLAGQPADRQPDVASALAQLAQQMATMSETERQGLAQSLAQMAAQAAQAGETSLSQSLAAMAQAAVAGDAQSADQAAQAASQAFSEAQSSLDGQAALQQALAQLQSSRQALAQSGQSQAQNQGEPGSNPRQGQNQGQTSGQSQGQAPGQGQNQGQGAGSGGGTKANTLPPFTGSGQYTGRPQGQGQNSGVTPFESQVYIPWERLTGGNAQLSIPGQASGQGQTQSQESTSPLPGVASQALVPYQAAYYNYLDIANQAIEQSYIPSGLKDYVHDYFAELEP